MRSHNVNSARRIRVRGFTLLEVLIALLVFSLGLIGLAGLLVLSVKTNYAATQRTQATFLAQSLAERMRANIIGVWQGNYDSASVTAVPAAACNPTAPAGCNPAGIASWDLSVWFDQVAQSLPAPNATIACTQNLVATPPDLRSQPPYEGTCTIRLTWSEAIRRGTATSAASTNAGTQTFSWVFTP
jgi:type IV pilus assembly protein PilV